MEPTAAVDGNFVFATQTRAEAMFILTDQDDYHLVLDNDTEVQLTVDQVSGYLYAKNLNPEKGLSALRTLDAVVLTDRQDKVPSKYGLVLGGALMLQGKMVLPFSTKEAVNHHISWAVNEEYTPQEIEKFSADDSFFMIGNTWGVFLPSRGFRGVMAAEDYIKTSPFPTIPFEKLGAALPDPVTIKQFRVAANV